ncbi:hypothetical protein FEM03_16625 [Phragmitibacter flavus]|uniref:Squalene cyclase C-terminal domain-containing protein n=1 Tax=Phragmitibacter flavus TaxID=2576071 RepID=A0A5R8KB93_9BACT|nr:prenyltransferase/squalene oxidase repeat-containing protein [Phragmitibacter flavus]TLD69582.1 hypothetical protein FEM03_16625 [Phragmitibacter flavus]
MSPPSNAPDDSQPVPIQPSEASTPVRPETSSVPIAPVQIQSLSATNRETSGSNSGPIFIPAAPSFITPPPSVAAQAQPTEVEIEYDPNQPPAIEYVAPPKKNAFIEYWRKAGGGSFMVSVGIHAAGLIAAYFVVETIVHEKQVDFLPGGGSKQGQEASQQLTQTVQQKKRSNLSKSTPMRRVTVEGANAVINLPDIPIDDVPMPETSSLLGGSMGGGGFGSGGLGSGGGFGTGQGIGGQAGFISLPPTMKSRCSSAERLQKLVESGGNPECERAVSQALEWLKTQQNEDGSWGRGNKAAMTGLALLCYLGRCETPDSPFYGDNVMKGILYLIELSKKNEHGLFTANPSGHGGAYEHGIATYALGEMYTLARMGSKSLPGMREAFERGVEIIIDQQNDKGSWGYYAKAVVEGVKVNNSDLSVAGWQFQALKAAQHTNLKIAGLKPAVDKTVKYLETVQTKDGGFGNTNREAHYNQWSLTGVGILGLQTLARAKNAPIRKGVGFAYDLFTKEPPAWNKNANLYCWYYYAQAFFQNGGEEWDHWNKTALPEILANQAPGGNWKTETPDWSAGGTAGVGADRELYRTVLCTLMLEVYYRYLKVGDKEAESIFNRR